MGFARPEEKGRKNELLLVEALLNGSTENHAAIISSLQQEDRMMDALVPSGVDTVDIDNTWFGNNDAGTSMWVDTSRNSVGEIHAIMRRTAVWLFEKRVEDPETPCELWAICDSSDRDDLFSVEIDRAQGAGELAEREVWRCIIHGPDNVSEGGGSETLEAVKGELRDRKSPLTAAERDQYRDRLEQATPPGKYAYYGTPLALSTGDRGGYPSGGEPRVEERPNGVFIYWPPQSGS